MVFFFLSDPDDQSQTGNGPLMSEHEFITYLIEMVGISAGIILASRL